MSFRIGVVTFPGSLDDRDAARAVEMAGGTAVPLFHASDELKEVQAVVLPGGFSYGDYLRCGAIARFAEINDRNAAEKLRSTLLTVPREALPKLDDGEYYYSDLLGLRCVSTDGIDLGTCVAVENFGASDVLEIQMPSVEGKPGKKFMVPMTADAVPEWTAGAGGNIVIDAAFVI